MTEAVHDFVLLRAAIAPDRSQEEGTLPLFNDELLCVPAFVLAMFAVFSTEEGLFPPCRGEGGEISMLSMVALGFGAQAIKNVVNKKGRNRYIVIVISLFLTDNHGFFKHNTLDSFYLQSNLIMTHRVIYPGTFDPITNGHIDIITRAARIFPEMIIAVASNEAKRPYFPLPTRIAFIQNALKNIQGLTVLGFSKLLIEFAEEQKASIILRGLRAVNDFEYEFQLAGMNRKLSANIETIFLTPSEHLMFISSSLVREIALLGGDISQFVPPDVVLAFKQRMMNG